MIMFRSLYLKRCVCTAPETTLFGDPEKRNQNESPQISWQNREMDR